MPLDPAPVITGDTRRHDAPPGPNWKVEWAWRLIAIVVYLLVLANLLGSWASDPDRWSLLVVLCAELFTLILVLCARHASTRDTRLTTLALNAWVGVSYALFQVEHTTALLAEGVCVAVQLAGVGLQTIAKGSLARSFGVLPAYRRLVTGGAYRWVRHPIYAGYLVEAIGTLFANFSLRNATITALLIITQCLRLLREESLLRASDPAYGPYQARVRWRIIPGLW